MQYANDSELDFDFSSVDNRFARASWGYSFLVSDAAESYAKLLEIIANGEHLTRPEFSNYVYLFISAELD